MVHLLSVVQWIGNNSLLLRPQIIMHWRLWQVIMLHAVIMVITIQLCKA